MTHDLITYWTNTTGCETPTRWNFETNLYWPKDFTDLWDRFFKSFSDFEMGDKAVMFEEGKLPKTNAYENEDGLIIQMSIPFSKKEDVKVLIDPTSRVLSIDVESHQDEEKDKRYHMREISRTSFKRSFGLNGRFDLSKADANFENGVLSIFIPYEKDKKKKVLEIK